MPKTPQDFIKLTIMDGSMEVFSTILCKDAVSAIRNYKCLTIFMNKEYFWESMICKTMPFQLMEDTSNSSNPSWEWDTMDPFTNLSTFPQSLMDRVACTLNTISSMITPSLLAKTIKMEDRFISILQSTQPANLSSMDLTTPQQNMSEVCMLWDNL